MTLTRSRTVVSLFTAGALLAVPAAGMAAKPADPGSQGKNKPTKAQVCAKSHNVGFTVHGTLVSATADDRTTANSEASVTLKITSANSHARRSGDIADQDAVKRGVQVKGAEYTVAAGDAYTLKLRNYEGTDTPSVGDRVGVIGKIALTKKRCATAGTSLADRFGDTNIRKVTISDRDADA